MIKDAQIEWIQGRLFVMVSKLPTKGICRFAA